MIYFGITTTTYTRTHTHAHPHTPVPTQKGEKSKKNRKTLKKTEKTENNIEKGYKIVEKNEDATSWWYIRKTTHSYKKNKNIIETLSTQAFLLYMVSFFLFHIFVAFPNII